MTYHAPSMLGNSPPVMPLPPATPLPMGGSGLMGGNTFRAIATVSGAVSAYHGYRRNNSVGWGVAWFLLGSMFPVIVPVIAVAQGYGKPAQK